jgi:uncharacterized membrane protein YsdA (DUF1294 family)
MTFELRVALVYLAAVNLVSFVAFGIDKARARRGAWRIPEKTLWLLGLGGGFVGGFSGMRLFRHKRRKASFLVVYWLVTIVSAALLGYLYDRFLR